MDKYQDEYLDEWIASFSNSRRGWNILVVSNHLNLNISKKLSHCHKLRFSKTFISATKCRRQLIYQTMNFSRSNNLRLKYLRFSPSGCQDIGGIWNTKFEFVEKTSFLY